eukprot:9040734-Alexandrium_andersonii.AAC.1
MSSRAPPVPRGRRLRLLAGSRGTKPPRSPWCRPGISFAKRGRPARRARAEQVPRPGRQLAQGDRPGQLGAQGLRAVRLPSPPA